MVTPKSGPQRSLGVYGCVIPSTDCQGKKISRSPGGQVAVSQHCNFKGPCAAWMGEILMLHMLPFPSLLFSLFKVQILAPVVQLRGASSPPVDQVALLEAGDASVYDGRILHCGTGNASERPRLLLVVTVRHPEGNVAPESRKTQRALRGAATLGELSELREKDWPSLAI